MKWEEEYGKIPEGAFVAFRSDWYKKENLDNNDAEGNPHYPGWDQVSAVGSLIFIGFPKLKEGTGFPTRVYAICPNE